MTTSASDDAVLSWLRAQLELPQLPTLIEMLKERRSGLMAAALVYGDTNKEKTQVAELTFVIDLFEQFDNYIDTETETAIPS